MSRLNQTTQQNVREIIEYGSLTSVPMMSASMRGVINLRGAVVPVIDLTARFSGRQGEIGRRTCIVIVEVQQRDERHEMGIVVDTVSEVLEIAQADIEPPPSFGANVRAEFIAGIGKVAGKFVMILEIARVLSMDDLELISAADLRSGAMTSTAAQAACLQP